jgi:Na+/melibiose symporter-like transporter
MRSFFLGLAGSWWSKGGYPWDVVLQLEIFGGVLRTWPWYIPRQVMQIVSLSLVEPFKKLFGGSYRKTVIFMRLWDFGFSLVPAFTGLSPKVIGSWWKAGLVYCVFQALITSNDAPSTVLEGEIGREISDYTEYVTGERPDGSIGILTQLAGKVTEPLRALWTIFVLKWSGYDPNVAGNRPWDQNRVGENSAMYSKVFFLYNFANIVPDIINMIPLFFYDIEGKKKLDMYAALNERRALIANESTMPAEMEALMEMMAEEEQTEVNA